jgi:O-antigen/teichoic acid export membrane protein
MNLSEKAGIITFGNIIGRISVILSGIVVARWLTQQELGTFRQINLIFSTLGLILLLGIPSSLYYFIPRAEEKEKQGIITQTFSTLALIGLFFSVIIYFSSPLFVRLFSNPELLSLIHLYSPYFAFSLPYSAFFAVMMSLNKTLLATAIQLLCIVLLVLATVVPVLLHCSLSTVFTTMLTTTILLTFFVIFYSIRLSPPGSLTPSKTFAIKQFKFSFPLGLSQFATLIEREIDKVFISSYFTVKQFATYSIGAVELPISSIIGPAIRTVLLPDFSQKFHKNNIDEILNIWKESRRKFALITFPIILFFYFISFEFITFMYSDKYTDSTLVFQIYLLIPFFDNFQSGVILHAKGKTKKLFYSSGIAVLLNILLSFVLINTIGIIGPAIATCISKFVAYSFVIKWASQELKINNPTLMFPLKDYGRILISSFIAGSCILIFRHTGHVSSQFLFLALSSTIYFSVLLVCYVFFVFLPEDYFFLKSKFSKIKFLAKKLERLAHRERLF